MSERGLTDRGILYFAKGSPFVEEATVSARQTKSVMPDCPITIVADREPADDCFDRVLLDETDFLKRDKPKAMQRTPYERTLYLDTDIYLERPVWELFDILEDFDVAIRPDRNLAHIPKDADAPVDGVPPGVPEFNGGVIAYRDAPSVMEFLADWESRCRPGHDWDQRTLRPALYHSDTRICPLEHRYNCMYQADNTVDGEVKVFHGPLVDRERKRVDIDTARDLINRTDEYRIHRTYMDELLVDHSPPITTRIPILARHFYSVCRERGIGEAARSTLRYLSPGS